MPTAWRCGRTTSYSLAGALCGPLDNTQASPTDEATVLEVLATKDTVALTTGVHAASPRGLVPGRLVTTPGETRRFPDSRLRHFIAFVRAPADPGTAWIVNTVW